MKSTTILLTLVVALTSQTASSHPFVGVNFALDLQVNPLPTSTAANTIAKAGFSRAKIFSHNAGNMNSLKNAGMKHVVVSIPNGELAGYDAAKANALVQQLTSLTDAGITCDVLVGNEPLASWYTGKYRNLIVPVFDKVKTAIESNPNADPAKIKITVAFQLGIIGKSYPPSKGFFASSEHEIIRQVASREVAGGSPFMINIYPYFARQDNPDVISLDYALGNTGLSKGGEIVRDYASLLDAQIGAVRASLISLDPAFGPDKLPIVLGETGWPTAGRDNDPNLSIANAKAYVDNTIRYVLNDGHVAGAYLFGAFDESRKSVSAGAGTNSKIENHWGLHYESGAPKYQVVIPATSGTSESPIADTDAQTTLGTTMCLGPYPSAFPECEGRIKWMLDNWSGDQQYTDAGVDGSRCSIQQYLSTHEWFCPLVLTSSINTNPSVIVTTTKGSRISPTTTTTTVSTTTTTSTVTTTLGTTTCLGPYSSAFPECEGRIKWVLNNWSVNQQYTDAGVDGSRCSIQQYLSTQEKWCPLVSTSPTNTDPSVITTTTTTKGVSTTTTTTVTTTLGTATCFGPYPSTFPECEGRIKWMLNNWSGNQQYTDAGVDGSRCSIQQYLSTHEKWCPLV